MTSEEIQRLGEERTKLSEAYKILFIEIYAILSVMIRSGGKLQGRETSTP